MKQTTILLSFLFTLISHAATDTFELVPAVGTPVTGRFAALDPEEEKLLFFTPTLRPLGQYVIENSSWLPPVDFPRNPYGYFAGVASKNRDKVYLFGGRTPGRRGHYINTIQVFDMNSYTYVGPLPSEGDVPLGREQSSAVIYGHHLVIYGGYPRGNVLKYNLKKQKWLTVVEKGNIPEVRAGHHAVARDGIMYVFGGFLNNTNLFTNEMLMFDLETDTWLDTSHIEGPFPTPRGNYASAVMNGVWYIFGGFDDNYDYLSSVLKFDLDEETWLESDFELPVHVCCGAAVRVPDEKAIYLAGLSVLEYSETEDPSLWVWKYKKTRSNK